MRFGVSRAKPTILTCAKWGKVGCSGKCMFALRLTPLSKSKVLLHSAHGSKAVSEGCTKRQGEGDAEGCWKEGKGIAIAEAKG